MLYIKKLEENLRKNLGITMFWVMKNMLFKLKNMLFNRNLENKV